MNRRKTVRNRLSALLLALCIIQGLDSPAFAAETAAAIRLSKTTGTVSVSKSSGKPLTLMSGMRLYNGYHVTTSTKSYAWINLDDAKLIKEDAASEVEVRKNGKKLEINVCSGNVFFDVSEKLADDESLNISTSTMIVGIRGTAGYVEVVDRWTTELTVLEGVIHCSVTDPVTGQIKNETVQGGETVQCVVYPQDQPGDKCDILREETAVEDIPGYVLTDVVRDMELCDRIEADTGTDLLEELAKIVGGDPSGRSGDGKSASPEILGEADRQKNRDETNLQEKQEQINAEQKAQASAESGDKIFGQTPGQSDASDDSGSSGGSSGGGSSGPVTVTRTMPLAAADLQSALNGADVVTIRKNTTDVGANSLSVDSLNVVGGKTLNLETGVELTVESGGGLSVAGTVNAGDLINNGTVTVSSGDTLRLSGNLSGSGELVVTATGRVVAEGSFDFAGTLSLTDGARVLSKDGFGSSPIPGGWEVSATADSNGYYFLYRRYTITFDAKGGTLTTDVSRTNEDGKLASLPKPTRSGYIFDGWYTAAESGTMVTTNTVFTSDTTVYAHWSIGGDGWRYDADNKTLTITKDVDTVLGIPWDTYKSEIQTVAIQSGVATIGTTAFMDCIELTKVTIPNGVTTIGQSAFRNCPKLTSVTIPASVNRIISEAFLASVTDIYFQGTETQWNAVTKDPDAIPAGVTVHCTDGDFGVYTVTFDPNGGTLAGAATATTAGGKLSALPDAPKRTANEKATATYTFDGWYDAKTGGNQIDTTTAVFTQDTTLYAHWTITSGWDWTMDGTALRIFGTGAMQDYSYNNLPPWYDKKDSIETVVIDPGVTSIGQRTFYEYTGLTSVTIPASVTSIGINAFYNCSGLTSITIPASVNSIDNFAFSDCTGLTTITFAANGHLTTIGSFAFSRCSKLTYITLPDSVTTIENSAFSNCTSLTAITIPASVNSIGEYVFTYCSALTSITYQGTKAQWGNVTKGTSAIPSDVTVRCTDGDYGA